MSTLCSSFVYQQYIFLLGLVPVENVPCINFIFDIIQHFTVTIGNDRITFTLKFFQIIDNKAAKESCAVFKGRLINNHRCTFALIRFITPWILL